MFSRSSEYSLVFRLNCHTNVCFSIEKMSLLIYIVVPQLVYVLEYLHVYICIIFDDFIEKQLFDDKYRCSAMPYMLL